MTVLVRCLKTTRDEEFVRTFSENSQEKETKSTILVSIT